MTGNQIFDVIIAGGGPAGLAAAKAAATAGLRVLVLEKSLEIGYPVHTSGGSWITELRELGIPEKYLHPIHTLEFISANQTARFDYPVPEICVIDIRAVYQHLAEEASLAGAVIYTNTVVLSPLYQDNELTGVRASRNGQPTDFQAKIVIDATGFSGILTREVMNSEPATSYGKGAEYEIITRGWQQDKTTILLGPDFSPVGYAWVFPYGQNRVRIGLGIIAPYGSENPLRVLEAFVNSSHPIARQLRPFSIVETHLGSLPNTGYCKKSYGHNFLVAGDAAGHVLGLAGEGIRLALDIGRMAGETAAYALRKNDVSERTLRRYESAWKKKYGRSIEVNARMNDIVRKYSSAQWDNALGILKEVDPEIILSLMKGYFDLKLVGLMLTKNPGLFAFNAMRIIRDAVKPG